MANPYELRWQMYQQAERQLKEKYIQLIDRWNDLIQKGQDPGIYPSYPTQDEIFALSLEIKNFVDDKELNLTQTE